MLHLAYSNRMELLVAPLVARIAQAQRSDPMAPVHLIVPNRAVAQFVRFRVAEALGIAANLEFGFLRRALTDAVQSDELQVVDVDGLTLVLHARFLDDDFLDAHDLAPVRAYLGAGRERPVRALQLAEQVARLFEEYGYSRQPMLRAWRRGSTLGDTAWARTEAWQRRLHRALVGADGTLDISGRADASDQLALLPGVVGPRRMLLTDALRSVDPATLDLPATLHVFGLSYVAPAFAEVFARLAHNRTLAVYALNPCLEFWEDVAHMPAVERAGWAHQGDKLASLDGDDPFALDRTGDTPALRLWGRPGREYIRLLNQLTDCVFDAAFADPLADGDTLLGRLQRDILIRAPERPWVADGPPPDDSIRFLACPGVRREVEIVADEIWAMVASGLRFHEIAVMVTDARRDDYLTHVHSVFRERHALPYNVIDGSLSSQTRVIEAIDRLLDLPTSDLAYTDLRPLLLHPAVGGALDGGDPERWRQWLDALQIRFGADREDLRGTYLDRDVHNWDQALRRLVLGCFMAGESVGDTTTVTSPVGEWLPFETTPDDLERVAVLVDLTRRLIADAKALAQATHAVADWAVLLARYVAPVQAADVVDEIALSRCLQALEAMGRADLEGVEVAFPVARDLFRRRLAGLDARRGQHQADGVVVSSLLPMRAIPFKAIFVLGLGEGDFPARVRNDPLDLRQARRRAGDVTSAERDRYLFLETLLACRQRLRLSYVARDPQTGDERSPSSVIRELHAILRGYVTEKALDEMTRTHPVSAFEPSAFRAADGRPPIVSPEAWAGAEARAVREDLNAHLGRPAPERASLLRQLDDPARHAVRVILQPPPEPPFEPSRRGPIRISLAAIRRFLESPLQGSAQAVLGLYEDAQVGLEEELDEPLSFDRFTAVSLLRRAFWAGGGDAAATQAAYEEAFELRALKGEAPVGLFAELAQAQDLERLDIWRGNAQVLDLDFGNWVYGKLGRAAEHERVDQLYPPIRMTINVAGEAVPVQIVGNLSPYRDDGTATLRCLTNKAVTEKHFLTGFLSTIALAMAGGPHPEVFRVGVIPAVPSERRAMIRTYDLPHRDVVTNWFRTVLQDLLSGVHAYRMPIDQVLKWWPRVQNSQGRLPNLPFMPREEFNSDSYGPVRDHWRFEMPTPEQAEDMVRRRLGLWFGAAR